MPDFKTLSSDHSFQSFGGRFEPRQIGAAN
jgi:hypothetical protein